MSLVFPNRSRSFDEARKAVRFLGYDGMFEVPFLVQAEALADTSGSLPMSDHRPVGSRKTLVLPCRSAGLCEQAGEIQPSP